MSPSRTFGIGSAAEAAEALGCLNAFHGGFIRRMVVTSLDVRADAGSRGTPRRGRQRLAKTPVRPLRSNVKTW
jgi:hypothetical protein